MADSTPKFAHLHVHTHYSLLDGANKIPDLVKQAKRLGMDSLAITDHGCMFGVVEFFNECKKEGIKPILGMEAYMAPGDRREKSGTPGETAYHLLLLAQNLEGYHNLLKLSSTRLPRRVLLQAADRQGDPAGAPPRPDRHQRLPGRRDPQRLHAPRQDGRGQGDGRDLPRHLRPRPVLHRGAEPHQGAERGQPRAGRAGQEDRRRAGGHERRPLPDRRRPPRPRRAVLHQHGQAAERREPAEVPQGAVPQERRTRWWRPWATSTRRSRTRPASRPCATCRWTSASGSRRSTRSSRRSWTTTSSRRGCRPPRSCRSPRASRSRR